MATVMKPDLNNVTLKPIEESNFLAAFALTLGEGQEEFVSHPIRSLAQAYVYRTQCTPFGVYDGDTMVGYLMVIYDWDEETYNIWHLMIDAARQGKGYGRAAMQLALNYIREKPFGDSGKVLITVNPENRAAWQLYQSLGFTRTGRDDEDEQELLLEL